MMVPRAFKYSSSPPMESLNEKSRRRSIRSQHQSPTVDKKMPSVPRPISPVQTTDSTRPPSQPVAVPKTDRSHAGAAKPIPAGDRRSHIMGRKKSSKHNPDALPPAVAALLAVTAIPPRRPNRFTKKSKDRRISIDELVNEWKIESSSKTSYSSSPALSILLEDVDDMESTPPSDSVPDDAYFNRTISCESMPSLEADNLSMPSIGSPSPSTPGSIRSRKSVSNLKRDRARSLSTVECCALDHPLASPPITSDRDEDDFVLYSPSDRASTPKPKSSFKSNLTTSLQALKNAALSSITSLGKNNTSTSPPTQTSKRNPNPLYDDMLWSHPYLFPRLSSEIRPDFDGMPTEAQRRYMNPMPLTFEEQEAPYQQALHAPFLAEQCDDVPSIQMQTYNNSRGRGRRASSKRGPSDLSEVGRGLSASGVRQREPRENSDFLRVVVLEMNMRREGKLENGRAKIWLPPRQVSPAGAQEQSAASTPRRWVGESAY